MRYLIALLPGGFVILALLAIVRWWRRGQDACEQARIDTLIVPPRQVFDKADDGLRRRTEARRATADQARRRAAHIESGASSTDVLRMVRGGRG